MAVRVPPPLNSHLPRDTTRCAHRDALAARCRRFGPTGNAGFTIIELLVVIGILAILAAIAISVLFSTRQNAYEITARHDLNAFVQIQESYYAENDVFIGTVGQVIRDPNGSSDFELPTFRASEGVVLTVAGGDPDNPYDKSAPYIMESKHRSAPTTYVYNFVTGQYTTR